MFLLRQSNETIPLIFLSINKTSWNDNKFLHFFDLFFYAFAPLIHQTVTIETHKEAEN